jgi:hypothetical protein
MQFPDTINTSVFGIASPIPTSIDDFSTVYAASGQAADCCTISLESFLYRTISLQILLMMRSFALLHKLAFHDTKSNFDCRSRSDSTGKPVGEVKFKLQLIRLKAILSRKERAYNILVTISMLKTSSFLFVRLFYLAW